MCGRYVIKIRNMKVQEISFLGMALVHADGQTDMTNPVVVLRMRTDRTTMQGPPAN
jgi:hypothetical protein